MRGLALLDQSEYRPVGSGRGDQSAHGVVREVFVRGIFHEYGGFGGRRAELQLREQECLIGLVCTGFHGRDESCADLAGEFLAACGGRVAHHAVDGVLHGGVLALGGGDEHPGHHPDSFGSGRGQLLHDGVERLGILRRKLVQSVRHDRRGGALACILRPGGERHEGQQEYCKYLFHRYLRFAGLGQIFHGVRIGWSISRVRTHRRKSVFCGSGAGISEIFSMTFGIVHSNPW